MSTERDPDYLGNCGSPGAKQQEQEATQAAYERQQKEIATQQAYIDRFRASATRSTQAKSREKQLEKVELVDAPIESVGGQLSLPHFPFRSGWL